MDLSKRIKTLTGDGSDGWDLYRKARRLKADGVDVVELTIGEHDIGTDAAILDAMHAAAKGGHTGYATLPGTEELRKAIAARVADRTGIPTTWRNVVVTPGGQSALFAAHTAACDPGDAALFIDPYYATYPGTIRGTGANAVAVRARAERGFQVDIADVAAAQARTGARSLLINSPNNPTGIVYSGETMREIADFARERNVWIISDEVYDTQIWEGSHLSPRQLPGMAERTLVVGSLSKSHAMTGSRLGWIVGPESAIEHLANLSTHTTYGVPGFIQDAGVFALSRGGAFEDRIAEPFRRRHALVAAFFKERGVPIVPSKASMYLMVDVRSTGLTGEAFAHQLIDRHAVAVMPGESFGTAAAGHLRVALTVDDERLMRAVGYLADLVSELTDAAA
ncbi:MAG: pyridoxal phosphate-dependent aminotransferase [Paracoccaceae bacterium]|nr:pyridoxal phosphate-dependent aminotransferase [Paracoccaceae bacterium]